MISDMNIMFQTMYVKNTCIEVYDLKEHDYKSVTNRHNIIMFCHDQHENNI